MLPHADIVVASVGFSFGSVFAIALFGAGPASVTGDPDQELAVSVSEEVKQMNASELSNASGALVPNKKSKTNAKGKETAEPKKATTTEELYLKVVNNDSSSSSSE